MLAAVVAVAIAEASKREGKAVTYVRHPLRVVGRGRPATCHITAQRYACWFLLGEDDDKEWEYGE